MRCVCFYGLFLSISNPTIAIAMIIAMVEPAKYSSNGVCPALGCGVGDGVGVAALAAAVSYVVAYELPYESSPKNVAVTVYCPSIVGYHV